MAINKDTDYEIHDELRFQLEIYCDINNVDTVYMHDISEGFLKGIHIYRNKAELFKRAESAVKEFYKGILSDNEMLEELKRVRKYLRENIYTYQRAPDFWGEDIDVTEMPEWVMNNSKNSKGKRK